METSNLTFHRISGSVIYLEKVQLKDQVVGYFVKSYSGHIGFEFARTFTAYQSLEPEDWTEIGNNWVRIQRRCDRVKSNEV